MNLSQRKDELHQLVEALPEEKTEVAKEVLTLLLNHGSGIPPEGLVERLHLLERIIDCLPDATLAVDRQGRVLVWNLAMEEMTGVKKEEILGKGEYAYAIPFYGIQRPILVDILLGNGKEWEQEYEKVERKGHILIGEGFAPCAYGGRGLHFWTLVAPIHDDRGNLLGAVQCIRDIGERKRMEEELRLWSTRDALTGLYNRAFFEEELQRLEKGRSFPISLVLCDLDGLKIVNDMLGHEQGDELLRRAAKVIAGCVRGSDVVARVGGDEFAIILPQTGRKTAEEVARRIIEAAEKDTAQHPDLPLSISVGAATAEDNSRPLREVYKEADDAMYMNKLASGKDPRAAVIRALKAALAEKDFHNTERMKKMVCLLGEAMGLSREEMDNLRLLVDVHDIGKLVVPASILLKPGPLTEEEWEEVRRHPEVGYRIALSSGELARVAPYILQHHERWDGRGYPQGLRGEQIHLLSRILAIADAYDAMTLKRPYRRPLTHEEALQELKRCAGKQFDPHLIEIFVKLFPLRKYPP
ncbi:PAS domain S-box-containing protein/diguanylate cyclase (GGDEF) domain-containing protein [Thermanaeromonas toyohensis ToBE]|uniref:PAS domain S-box-containing protein/diguanylate cyclase (GGDEF) domain-containing protein n=1 Tax=Thermanaeromonas toyohensis ToBE TaxID=698762 RepID=A0A1W1W2G8_9FIRM|nr:diguanylate cyclase [Thermanaeromonas toyohensis]SMB99786.1 PAS domain S-box-containing protein/diguanylate cyclase (GGDEF) domain-containing protein [Thermanaeromonas toyohensis ToBE]